jgi:hypothetical protein
MIVCSVLGRAFKIEGHLKHAEAMHDVPQVRALDAEELDRMIEPCVAPPKKSTTRRGVGAQIRGVGGDLWGRVVCEEFEAWPLESGRIAKKRTEGIRWEWDTDELEDTPGQISIDIPAEKSDMIFVQGLEGRVRPGFSVVNSEYIAFHPHQCLPKYEITYEL